MEEEILQLTGKEGGPTSMILAGVHGNEMCGVEAIKRLLPFLQIKKGRVFIGFGNPKAIDRNARFTEVNLNRMFKSDELLSENEKKSYEYKRAQFLKKYLNQSDVLLDVHASFTPKSTAFIICEANAKDIVKYLSFDLMVSGIDEVEPGGTDYYMNSIGKIGICAECGYLGDERSTQAAEETVKAFLVARGHVDGEVKIQGQSFIKMYCLYSTKTDKFVLSRGFDDFENVSQGEVIGIDGAENVTAPKDSIILFARNRNKVGDEAFLLGEYRKDLA